MLKDLSTIAHYNASGIDSLFYKTDSLGFLLPPVNDFSAVEGINRIVLNDLTSRLEFLLGSSLLAVYFRGSQLYSQRLSDFDTVVVLETVNDFDSVTLSAELNRFFSRKYFHINHFDTLVINKESLYQNRSFQFLVKVLSVHVSGKPLHEDFDGFRPNKDVIFLLDKLPEKLNKVFTEISRISKTDKYKASNYLIKYLIRSAFELVICKESRYTRELNMCQSLFVKHFPEYENISSEILNYYNQKDFDLAEFTVSATQFAEIILTEYKITLDS